MNKKQIERAEERLDIQYNYCKKCDPEMKDENAPSWIYYKGMIDIIEAFGFYWERLESGKHIIYTR